MVLHPAVMRRAQEELDTVVGTDRLPTFSDRPNLPYIEAIVKEVARWNTVVPMGKNVAILVWAVQRLIFS